MPSPVPPIEPPVPDTAGILEALARINERLDALEAAFGEEHEALRKRQVDIDKLAWFMAHGRKRPW